MSGGVDTVGLCDLLDRLLDNGVVIRGSVVISIADVDIIHVELAVLFVAADRLFDGLQTAKLDYLP